MYTDTDFYRSEPAEIRITFTAQITKDIIIEELKESAHLLFSLPCAKISQVTSILGIKAGSREKQSQFIIIRWLLCI